MRIVKPFAVFTACALVFSLLRSPLQASVANDFSAHAISTLGYVQANQSQVLLDVTLPNPGLDMVLHDASSATNTGDALMTTTLRYVDGNGNGAYDDGEFLVYDTGVTGTLEAVDFHETGTLPASMLQPFSSTEPSFVGYLDANDNATYDTGERVLAQEAAGPSGTLNDTPDPIPFTIYEKILDTNGNGSYDPMEPIVYDTDNSYSLSFGDDIRSPSGHNTAPKLRLFNGSNAQDQKVCVDDVGSSSQTLDDSDRFWWDSAGTCTTFTSGVDVILAGTSSITGPNMRVVNAINMAAPSGPVWLGYWDNNNDGSYTCARTGSCETLIKSDYITPQIVAGAFNGGEEILPSSTHAQGCRTLASCIAWDEANSGIGTLAKELSLYHVVDTSATAAYGYKNDILDVVDMGTVANATDGRLRAFPSTYRYYGSASGYNGSQAILSITGSNTLASATDIRRAGPITLATLPSNVRFVDKNGNGIREVNEDIVSDADASSTYRSHTLQSFTVQNSGTAQWSDFSALKLYQETDGQDGLGGSDTLVGSWSAPYFNTVLTPSAQSMGYGADNRRFYVSGTLAAAPVQGRTIQLAIGVSGAQFSSSVDGPLDQAVASPTTFTIGTAPVTPTPIDITPPNPVNTVWASGGNGQITISWHNPTSDFSQTIVRASTSGYPSSTIGGAPVYAGSGTSVSFGAPNGVLYYISLWALDAAGNVSSRMVATATAGAPSVTTTPITVVPSGSLIKASPSAVYYYSGGKRYVFPNEAVFYTWFDSFSGLYTITDSDMSTVPLGPRITIRPGTSLMKIQSDNRVWAVEPGGVRRWVASEAIASALYGPNWNRLIVDQDVTLWPDYTEGLPLTTVHPNGTVILIGGNTYVIENGFKRLLTSEGYTTNRVQWKHVVQPIINYIYPTGSPISSYLASYSDVTL